MDRLTLIRFLFPRLNRGLLLRIFFVTLMSWLLFGYLLLPLRLQGHSMEPSYKDGSLAFCWRLQYLFSSPRRFDVVGVRFAGNEVMLLKRVVALPGETVAFEKGTLLVNGAPLNEPYVHYRSDWHLAERRVAPDHIYIIGDNRSTEMDSHRFGQVSIDRVVGGILP